MTSNVNQGCCNAQCLEKLVRWMLRESFATGHGDTIEDLLGELSWQIEELRVGIKGQVPTGLDQGNRK